MNELTKDGLSKISELILQGIECWLEAGKIIVKALDDEPGCLERIMEVTGLDENIIRRFYQIGRKELHPRILCSTSAGIRKLAMCPYHEQELYLSNPIDVLVSHGETLKVYADNLTKEHIKQVFNSDHVRSLPEQKAWLATEESKHIEKEAARLSMCQEEGYVIKGKKVFFKAGVVLTGKEIAQILARL